MAVVTSVVAAGVAVAGTVASHRAAKKSARAQAKANEAQAAANRLKNKQAKRAFLKQFRQAQANVLVESVMAGVGLESSRFQGTRASHESQRVTALQEFAEFDRLGAEVTQYSNLAAKRSARASLYSGIAGIASSFIGFQGFGGGGTN